MTSRRNEQRLVLRAEAPGHEQARLRLDLLREGCGSHVEFQLAAVRSTAPLVATLERGPCEGTCPAYRVVVHADGLVEWYGLGFVAVGGQDTHRLTPERLGQLGEALQALERRMERGEATGCGDLVDAPTATLSWRTGGANRKVAGPLGCGLLGEGQAAWLDEAVEKVEGVIGVSRWVAAH